MKTANLFLKSALVLAMAVPLLASAESNIVTGTATATGAKAKLDFKVVIPSFIALKVGTGTLLTNDPTVDLVDFTLTDAQAAAGGAVAATAGGTVNVALLSNVGQVAFSSAGTALTDAVTGDTIALTKITATDTGNLAHPVFGAGATTVSPATGKVINLTDVWTFSYDHDQTTVGAGTYETTVTYTAAKL